MSTALANKPVSALSAGAQSGRMAVADIISHVALVQEVMRAVMKPDVHFGVIPGTDKPTLLKQGAEVLCMAFRVADSYQVEDLSTADVVRYRVTCLGTHQTTGIVLGSGMGEASSGEEKYKWRKASSPQEFEDTPANMRRTKHFKKRNGEGYSVQQVRTEPADLANTVLKMANKRAKIAMTINVTACGDMFGQDLEDMDEALRDHLTRHGQDQQQQQQGPTERPALPDYSQADFDKNLPQWRGIVKSGRKTPDELIAMVSTKGVLSDAMKQAIRDLAKPQDVTDVTPKDESSAEQQAHADFVAEMGD